MSERDGAGPIHYEAQRRDPRESSHVPIQTTSSALQASLPEADRHILEANSALGGTQRMASTYPGESGPADRRLIGGLGENREVADPA